MHESFLHFSTSWRITVLFVVGVRCKEELLVESAIERNAGLKDTFDQNGKSCKVESESPVTKMSAHIYIKKQLLINTSTKT